MITRNKVFKNEPSKICGRQPLKSLKWYGLLVYHFKFFKGCLPQILLGPFLNTFSHMPSLYYCNVDFSEVIFNKIFQKYQVNWKFICTMVVLVKLQNYNVSALIVNCFSRWKGVVKLTVSFILIIILLNNFGNLFSSPWRINVIKVFNDFKFPGYFNTYHAFGLSSIYSLWKHQKTWGFLVFSGVIEIYLLHDIG